MNCQTNFEPQLTLCCRMNFEPQLALCCRLLAHLHCPKQGCWGVLRGSAAATLGLRSACLTTHSLVRRARLANELPNEFSTAAQDVLSNKF